MPGGFRDFFLYRDPGITEATHGKGIAHLVKANVAPETGTGWHRREADFQIAIMTKCWAKFMYEDKETLVQAGHEVHQRPGGKFPGELGAVSCQNSASSSSISSGSALAAATHSCMAGSAMMALA